MGTKGTSIAIEREREREKRKYVALRLLVGWLFLNGRRVSREIWLGGRGGPQAGHGGAILRVAPGIGSHVVDHGGEAAEVAFPVHNAPVDLPQDGQIQNGRLDDHHLRHGSPMMRG